MFLIDVFLQGPIVQDLGGLPPSDTAMPLDRSEHWKIVIPETHNRSFPDYTHCLSLPDSPMRFEELLDSIPDLKMMTISPHLEAAGGYQRTRALLSR